MKRTRAVVAAILVAMLTGGCSAMLTALATNAYWRTMPARFNLYRKCMTRLVEKRAARGEEANRGTP